MATGPVSLSASRFSRRGVLWLMLALFALIGIFVGSARNKRPASSDIAAQRESQPPAAGNVQRAGNETAPRVAADRSTIETAAADLPLRERRLARAQFTLDNYVKATRYPPTSRPMSEHPDRLSPQAPTVRTLPLVHSGMASADVEIKLTQDRQYVVGDESARFSVRCADSLGKTVSCTIENASAQLAPGAAPPVGGRYSAVPIEFTDDGRGGDEARGDGTYTATLTPAAQGFHGYAGALRLGFTVRAAEESSELFFDILYTGAAPARFTGQVREAVEAGSLQLYVGIEVQKAGRYVISGRVDDGRDRPLAYLQFNDPLREGVQEVKLTVFGKLLHDASPAWPLKLRDVDGFLLYEDRDPDREHLAMLAGVVYRSQSHGLGEFSADEWQSEERDRHITEYKKDVAEAQAQLPH